MTMVKPFNFSYIDKQGVSQQENLVRVNGIYYLQREFEQNRRTKMY